MQRGTSILLSWLLSAVVVLLAACGGGDSDIALPAPPVPPTTPAPTEATATIGSAGGTLVGPDGAALVVPPGALAESTTFKIAKTSAGAPTDPPGDSAFSGAVYEFTPHGLTFLEPVTVTIPTGSTPAGAALNVFTAGPGDTGWRLVQSAAADGKSTWQTYAFSWFTPGVCATSAGADPRKCIQARIDAQLAANPSNAFTLSSESPNHKAWRVTQAAVFRLAFEMSAPSDCGNARLVVTRRAVAGQPAATVLDQSVLLVVDPANANVARRSADLDFTYGNADNGRYVYDVLFRCVRPNGAGRAVGGNAFFTVDIPAPPPQQLPTFTGQPANVTVTEPAPATFSAAAAGSPTPTLQWQRSADGVNWVDIPGAIANSFTLSATSASADNGARFRAIASNAAGSAPSDAALLTVTAPVTGSWQAPETVAGATFNRYPSVGFDASGRAIATWLSYNSSTGERSVLAAVRSSAGAWSTPVVLDSGFVDSSVRPRIAVAPDGKAVLAYQREHITIARRFDGSTWSSQTVVHSAGSAEGARVAIDQSGRAIVAWVAYDGAVDRTLASVSLSAAGNSWSAPVALDGFSGKQPELAVNSEGRGFVIFSEYDANFDLRVVARSINLANAVNDVIGAPQPLTGYDARSPREMTVAVDDRPGDITAIVVWPDLATSMSSRPGLLWRRFAGGAWSTTASLGQVDWASSNLSLAMNASGAAVVAWGERVPDGPVSDEVIFTRRLGVGEVAWGARERRSPDVPGAGDYARNPRVALSDAGRIAITWVQEGSTSGFRIWGQVHEASEWKPAQAIQTSAGVTSLTEPHALAMDDLGMPLSIWAQQVSSGLGPLVGAVWR